MIEISRRDAVFSATAAGLAFGLEKRLAVAPAAAATGGFHRYRVGDVEATAISDGIWEKPHDEGFIRNATVADTKAALVRAGLGDATVPIPFTVTVAKIGGRTIMFDSGTGAQLSPTAGKLRENMAAAGIDPAKIDTIVVTHFHPDHIFGLMAKDTNEQIYPKAEIIVPEAEYKWWTDPSVFTALPEGSHGLAKRIQATFPAWKNVRRIAGEGEVVPGVRAAAAHGHTPGHTVYFIGTAPNNSSISPTRRIFRLFS